jgi:Arc/MetJ-type ribon-helix-helix transcriptional regulator
MNITLTLELEQLVQTKVSRGEYDSAETFVSEAVQRLVEDEENKEDTDFGEIRARIEAAEAGIDSGDCIEYDETTIRELVNGVHDRGLKRPALADEASPRA